MDCLVFQSLLRFSFSLWERRQRRTIFFPHMLEEMEAAFERVCLLACLFVRVVCDSESVFFHVFSSCLCIW